MGKRFSPCQAPLSRVTRAHRDITYSRVVVERAALPEIESVTLPTNGFGAPVPDAWSRALRGVQPPTISIKPRSHVARNAKSGERRFTVWY